MGGMELRHFGNKSVGGIKPEGGGGLTLRQRREEGTLGSFLGNMLRVRDAMRVSNVSRRLRGRGEDDSRWRSVWGKTKGEDFGLGRVSDLY